MGLGHLPSASATGRSFHNVADVAGLFEQHLHDLGAAASRVKDERFGRAVFWVRNCHLNYTNICEGTCRFCHFRRKDTDEDAFVLGIDQIVQSVADAVGGGIHEVHVVGSLNASLDAAYYVDLVDQLRRHFPQLYIKAFTAVELDFVSRRCRIGVADLLARLRDVGLDCLAGGGAEIFADRVRSRLCPEKISADRWLEIHRLAHKLGLRSNATMLFGHIETAADRADHLLRLRALQDETGGFQAFLPLPVVDFDHRHMCGTDALKVLAVSRLVLDNVAHIKVFWPIWTTKLAQLALSYGADDFGGTVGRYRIVDSSRSVGDGQVEPEQVQTWIRQAGFEPIERTGDYGGLDMKSPLEKEV